ncbi:MAG: DUF4102 domain-containing protein [Gloeomargaritaceae cyanobacterium C42_A2020_066]|nr:DUF4102 domain-containing protein [Gloeomargaritaceae cyanobacterium C42_A2020_066]
MPLTDAQLRTLKANGQRQRHYDTGGLYLEVPPSGNPRWRVKYHYAGKEQCLSLGVYPTISLKQARTQRDDLKRQLAQDIDPSLARQATRSTGR